MAKRLRTVQVVATPLPAGNDTAGGGDDGGGGGTTPEWLPDGAVGFLDFENAHYYADGAETSAVATVSDPSKISSGALVLIYNTDTAIEILGSLATYLAALNWTVVVDYELSSADGYFSGSYIVAVVDDEDSTETSIPAADAPGEFNPANDYRQAAITGFVDDGRYKTAVTRTVAKLAASINGSEVVSDTTVLTGPFEPTKALIGGYSTDEAGANGVKIYSIAIYPPRPDADLPALSALSGGGGTTPEWLPEGAVAFADFVNGHYYAGGAERSLSEVISHPERNTEVGYVTPNFDVISSTSDLSRFTGAFKSALIGLNATLVMEVAAGATDYLLGISNDADNLEVSLSAASPNVYVFAVANGDSQNTFKPYDISGIARIALTVAEAGASLSVNGSAAGVLEFATPYDHTLMTEAVLAGYVPNFSTPNTFLSVTVYPPVPDADLPALSALPAPTTPEWLPTSAVAFADFVNGHYWLNGASAAAADFVTLNDAVIDSGGLTINEIGAAAPEASATVVALLNTPFTLTADWDVSAYTTTLFQAMDGTTANSSTNYFDFSSGSGAQSTLDGFSHERYSYSDGAAATLSTISRIALTLTETKQRAAANGTLFEVNDDDSGLTDGMPTVAHLWLLGGADGSLAGSLAALAIYPPVPDADLPALSALS